MMTVLQVITLAAVLIVYNDFFVPTQIGCKDTTKK